MKKARKRKMKKKNSYATTNGNPIKAPKSATADEPKGKIVTSKVDMRARVNE